VSLVIVTSLLRVKFKEEGGGGGGTDHSEGDSIEPVPSMSTTEGTAEPGGEGTAERVRRMARTIAKVAAVEAFSRPVPIPEGGPIEARLDALEKSINAKLELLSGGSDIQKVVSGVASLAAQVKLTQQEIDGIKKQIEEEKGRGVTTVTPAALEGMKRELEELRTGNAALESTTRSNDARIQEIQTAMRGSAQAAQARTRTLIKRMMDDVYHDTTKTFEDRKMYGAAEVSANLRTMLKKHSVACFTDIDQNGLF
jgi:hypothetical protein